MVCGATMPAAANNDPRSAPWVLGALVAAMVGRMAEDIVSPTSCFCAAVSGVRAFLSELPQPALETTIKLQPKHADAHIALGAFHAEVIDKVGSLLGRTQGASKDQGLAMFKQAIKLNPDSAIAMVEYANGLVMLEGDKKMKDAEKLYADAAASTPLDAMERLDVEMAKAELED